MIRTLLILVLSNPLSLTEHSSVDIIEVNTVLDDVSLCPRLTQVIFWSGDGWRYGVRDYRLNPPHAPALVRGSYSLVLWDSRDQRLRVVRCLGWIRTTTLDDPEMNDRAFRSPDERETLPK